MPEGDTVWRAAAALRRRLVGQTVERSSHTGLEGRRVESVDSAGKHLLIRFAGGWTLHSHLGMTGSWHLYRVGERWRRPAWQVRAMLECPEAVAVCFAPRRVALTRDAAAPVAHLGPDILRDDFDVAATAARLRAGWGAVAIGEVLLDQRACAGIGNVWRCEALWEHRIDPWAPLAAVDEPTLTALLTWTRELMRGNLHGPIARHFTRGRPAAVHSRGRKPCLRCRTPIVTRPQGPRGRSRITYFCPSCQQG